MYITYEEYAEIYGPMENFQRLHFDACQLMDKYTTGVDGIKKLRKFFPTEEADAEAVKYCAAKLIDTLNQIQEAEKAMAVSRGYTETENGLRRNIVSRVESGNEAISYMEPTNKTSAIDKAVASVEDRNKLVADIIRSGLSGVRDANGVNLLYMGIYPRR